MEKEKILKEDILQDILSTALGTTEPEAVEIIPAPAVEAALEDKDDITLDDIETGVKGLIVNAIQEKWQVIDTYNSYIVTLKNENVNQEIIDVFSSILDKELSSVSDLQKCLSNVDKQVEDNLE